MYTCIYRNFYFSFFLLSVRAPVHPRDFFPSSPVSVRRAHACERTKLISFLLFSPLFEFLSHFFSPFLHIDCYFSPCFRVRVIFRK